MRQEKVLQPPSKHKEEGKDYDEVGDERITAGNKKEEKKQHEKVDINCLWVKSKQSLKEKNVKIWYKMNNISFAECAE